MIFKHIINPVKVNQNSDLFIAQPVIFESIKQARKFGVQEKMEITNYTAQYQEDKSIIPHHFTILPNLTKSVLDIFRFQFSRKLPLIDDVLSCIPTENKDEFYIYTNVDIGLMPHFYNTINCWIKKGYDAIAVNRRTISDHYKSVDELPLIYSDIGKYHKGIDCFVFSRAAYQRFNFANTFIGAGAVGLAFVANMITHCKNFVWVENEHLTFHIGDDRSWKADKYKDYRIINNKEVCKIVNSCLEELLENDLVKRRVLLAIKLQLEITIKHLEGKKSKNQLKNKAKDYIRWYSQKKYDKILEEEPFSKKRFNFFRK